MKMTKVLFGAMALTMVLGLASCKNEDDDPEGAITKVNSDNYTVYYDNANGYGTEADKKDTSLSGVYRAWKRTSLKHLGALTKITLKAGKDTSKADSKAGNKSGVMGFAWDLMDSDSDDKAETFNVVGIRNWDGTLQVYVSRYYNVSNKQANNFGATTLTAKGSGATIASTAVTGTVEWDVSDGFKTIGSAGSADTVDVWVDVAIVPPSADLTSDTDFKKYGTYSTRNYSAYPTAVGSWVIAIYTEDPSTVTSGTAMEPKNFFVIPAATATSVGSGYDADGTNGTKFSSSSNQKRQAVYANIYQGATLSGEWNYSKTYLEAEVIEEDAE